MGLGLLFDDILAGVFGRRSDHAFNAAVLDT